MITSEINAISYKLGTITGIVFYIVYAVFRYYGRKKTMEHIENNLQDGEYIVDEPRISFTMDIGVFGIGAFFGTFILPFWFYDSIQFITISGFRAVTRTTMPYFAIYDAVGMIFLLIASSLRTVLTNNRILSLCALSFINNWKQNLNIKYTDISSVVLNDNILFPDFYIITVNDKKKSLIFLANQEEVKEEIEQRIKNQKN